MLMVKHKYLGRGRHIARTLRTHVARIRQYGLVAALALMLCAGITGTVTATTTSTSPHYSVTETQFGGGSQQHQCSTTYCAQSSTGDTTVGKSSSANYSASSGSNTSDIPRLEVTTTGGHQDLGTLDSTTTGTAVYDVDVLDYLMQGYSIVVNGAAPKSGSHTLASLGVPTTSVPGEEQFGLNLVANSSPGIGANPYKKPTNESASSYISSGYANANAFKYVDGDTVAQNMVENGETHYTISMILNVSNVTPGGTYKSDFSAIVVPYY